MKRFINILDVCLVLVVLAFVVTTLFVGREPELPLPQGNHITVGLSQRNLFICMAVLWIRLHLRSGSGEVWLCRFARSLSPFLVSSLIAFLSFLVFLNVGSSRAWPSGDTIPIKLQPISILEHGNLNLEVFRAGIPESRAYGFYRAGGQLLSAYPPGAALTALPVYGAFKVLAPEPFDSWRCAYAVPNGDDLPNVANYMERFSSSLISALSVVVFWLICVRVTKDRMSSLWFTAAYALGTSLLSTASLALWQHGPACLFLGLMILLLLKAEERGRWSLVLAGLSAGWAYVCRPTVAVALAPLALWVVWKFRWRALEFLLASAVLGVGVMVWNRVVYGSAAGGYSQLAAVFVPFDWNVFLALLFSPSRGLFVFSPFLLVAAAAGLRSIPRSPLSLPAFCLYASVANLVLFSCWETWSAGSSFGSRYLCEAALLLSLLLPFCFHLQTASRWLREAFILAVLCSCFIHITGARQGDHGWTSRAFRGDDLAAAWKWRDSQLVWTMIGGPDDPTATAGE